MTLSLYEYGDETEPYMKNMFHWFPEEEQWWITGFTGRTQEEFIEPKPIQQVLIGTVDFSERPDLYEGLKDIIYGTGMNYEQKVDYKNILSLMRHTGKYGSIFMGKEF